MSDQKLAANSVSEDHTVTAVDFDRDPKAAYDASAKGPIAVLDSEGRPSMTLVQPTAPVSSDVHADCELCDAAAGPCEEHTYTPDGVAEVEAAEADACTNDVPAACGVPMCIDCDPKNVRYGGSYRCGKNKVPLDALAATEDTEGERALRELVQAARGLGFRSNVHMPRDPMTFAEASTAPGAALYTFTKAYLKA